MTINRLLPTLLALVLLCSSGCIFHRKAAKAKQSPDIATETATDFQQRWVSRRLGELTTQGVDAITARQQALREFREKFPYATPKTK